MIYETFDADAQTRGGSRQHRDRKSVVLLGVRDLAEKLGTSERFVRRLVCERRVPFHKVGKFVRFDPRDIDLWLAEHRVESVDR